MMAQKHKHAKHKKWECGQKCEIYSKEKKCWTKGEVIGVFSDNEDKWIKVKYCRNVKEIRPNDEHIRKIVSGVNWHNLVEAVRQELYPLIATALGQSIDELVATGTLKEDDLTDSATDKVIEMMKNKKVLYNKEIGYIRDLVKRANTFHWEETQSTFSCHSLCPIYFSVYFEIPQSNTWFESDDHDVISDAANRRESDEDLNVKYPGLTAKLLVDIFSVHKALLFGKFNFTNFTKKDFMSNIKEAEERMFGESICSPILKANQSAFNLSFHPFYIINDDIFEVMAFHFAVSSLVNRLLQNEIGELHIRSYVIPTKVTSIFDAEVDHKSTIKVVDVYLNTKSSSNLHLFRRINQDLKNIKLVTQILFDMIEIILQRNCAGDIIIALNRRNMVNRVCIFECNDRREIAELYQNYFIGFDFNLKRRPLNETDFAANHLVRCWLRFGAGEILRFFPESLLWIVPRLFARSDRMTMDTLTRSLLPQQRNAFAVSDIHIATQRFVMFDSAAQRYEFATQH